MNYDLIYPTLQALSMKEEFDDVDKANFHDIMQIIDDEQIGHGQSDDLTDKSVGNHVADENHANTILMLVKIVLFRHLGDPYRFLAQLRKATSSSYLTTDFFERLAASFLETDLPWGAIALLRDRTDSLSPQGQRTFELAQLACGIIRDDASSIAQKLYENPDPLTSRLLDLIGVPPLRGVGPYESLEDSFRERPADTGLKGEGESGSSPIAGQGPSEAAGELRNQDAGVLRDIRGRQALIATVLRRQPEPIIQAKGDRPVHPQEQAAGSSTFVSRAGRRLARIVDAVLREAKPPKFNQYDLALLRECAAQTQGSDPDEPGARYDLVAARPLGQQALFVFHVRHELTTRTRAVVISNNSEDAVEVFGITTIDGLTISRTGEAEFNIVQLTPGGDPHVILSTSMGSGRFLTLLSFDPNTKRTWTIAEHLPFGLYSIISLGADQPPCIVVSFALPNQRFSKATQAPSRRRAVVIQLDASNGEFVVLGVRSTGTDEIALRSENPMGLGPAEMQRLEFNTSLARLSKRSLKFLESGLVKEVYKLTSQIKERYFPFREFKSAIDLFSDAIDRLSVDCDQERVLYSRSRVVLDLIEALVYDKEIDKAWKLTNDELFVSAAEQFEDIRKYRLGLISNVAILRGDYRLASQSIEAWRSAWGTPNAPTEGTFARFLQTVGDRQGTYFAALKALDLATADNQWANIARDMNLLAQACGAERPIEATDWLSRALRISRSFGDTDLTGMLLHTAADIAVAKDLPLVAITLLDLAFISMGAGTWESIGASMLLLYGRALELISERTVAKEAYRVAAELARRERGADLIAALARQAALEDSEGNTTTALKLSEEAFLAILDGRLRIGQEQYKLSFVGTKKEVADQYFGTLLRTQAPSGLLLDRIESWRLQTFRDVFAQNFPSVDETVEIARAVQTLLAPFEAFVSYAIGTSTSFAICITAESVEVRYLSANRDGLARYLSSAQELLNPENPRAKPYIELDRCPRKLEEALASLYEELITPLALPTDTRLIAISPDEYTASVPWGVLIPEKPGFRDAIMRQFGRASVHSLYEQCAVAIVPSARLLLAATALNREKAVQRDAIVIGSFDAVPTTRLVAAMPLLGSRTPQPRPLPALEHGTSEFASVTKALRESSVTVYAFVAGNKDLIRGHCRELSSVSEAISAMCNTRIIHVIAHAIFNSLQPMQSSLFLDDVALNAVEILQLDLNLSGLVVFSACETALARHEVGAEPFGFLRGLLGAGAKTIILTRWPVDDAAMAKFFASFYRTLERTGAAEALRTAALETASIRRHPFFWGAPVLYGLWR